METTKDYRIKLIEELKANPREATAYLEATLTEFTEDNSSYEA